VVLVGAAVNHHPLRIIIPTRRKRLVPAQMIKPCWARLAFPPCTSGAVSVNASHSLHNHHHNSMPTKMIFRQIRQQQQPCQRHCHYHHHPPLYWRRIWKLSLTLSWRSMMHQQSFWGGDVDRPKWRPSKWPPDEHCSSCGRAWCLMKRRAFSWSFLLLRLALVLYLLRRALPILLLPIPTIITMMTMPKIWHPTWRNVWPLDVMVGTKVTKRVKMMSSRRRPANQPLSRRSDSSVAHNNNNNNNTNSRPNNARRRYHCRQQSRNFQHDVPILEQQQRLHPMTTTTKKKKVLLKIIDAMPTYAQPCCIP
jgi:hypothetical protein